MKINEFIRFGATVACVMRGLKNPSSILRSLNTQINLRIEIDLNNQKVGTKNTVFD